MKTIEDTINKSETIMVVETSLGSDGVYRQLVTQGDLYDPVKEDPLKEIALDIQKQVIESQNISAVGRVTFGYDEKNGNRIHTEIIKPS